MQDLHVIGLPLLSPLAAITLTSFSVTWDGDMLFVLVRSFSPWAQYAYEILGKCPVAFPFFVCFLLKPKYFPIVNIIFDGAPGVRGLEPLPLASV